MRTYFVWAGESAIYNRSGLINDFEFPKFTVREKRVCVCEDDTECECNPDPVDFEWSLDDIKRIEDRYA